MIPEEDLVDWIRRHREQLIICSTLEKFPLGFAAADIVFSIIPEPDPIELRGFLVLKRRWSELARCEKFEPLAGWPQRNRKKAIGDVLVWAYLRFAAKFLSEQVPKTKERYRAAFADADLPLSFADPLTLYGNR